MNEREQVLTRELADEAERIDVDVEALWHRVQREAPASRVATAMPAPRRRGALVPAAAGLAAAAVVAAIAVAQQTGESPGPDRLPPAAGPIDRPIGDWACDDQATVSPGQVPVLSTESGKAVTRGVGLKPARVAVEPGSPPAEATAYGVPFYHFVIDGDTGRLLYGDDQQQLISSTSLAKDGGSWVMGDRRVCAGVMGLPSPYPVKLAAYTSEPVPFPADSTQVLEVPPTGEPIVLDDRTYYDEVGLLRDSTLYAYPTARGVMLLNTPADDTMFRDRGFSPGASFAANLIDGWQREGSPYAFRGWDQGEVFAVFSKGDDVTGLSTENLRTGQVGIESSVEVDGGTLYLVETLPEDEVQQVTTHHADGSDTVEVY